MIDSKQPSPDYHIIELLPWYVNGSLSPGEKAEVDAYLVAHPEYQEEIEWLRKLQNTASDDIDIPRPDVSRLMQKLDKLEQSGKQSSMHQLRRLFDRFFTPTAAWAAVPIALAMATVLFLMPSQTGHNGDFQTLSSGDAPAALTISVITVTDDKTALIDQMKQLAPAVEIKTGTDNQLLLIISEATRAETALELLHNIQSLPAVKSAELVTSN